MTRKDGKCNVMTLIERMAKQDDKPCLLCCYEDFCSSEITPEIRKNCSLNRKWRDFRKEAYKDYLKWCSKALEFKE